MEELREQMEKSILVETISFTSRENIQSHIIGFLLSTLNMSIQARTAFQGGVGELSVWEPLPHIRLALLQQSNTITTSILELLGEPGLL